MTRLAWDLAAILAASSAVCAQQNEQTPKFHPTEKGLAQPIPSWNVHGRAAEIPNLVITQVQQAVSTLPSAPPPKRLIIPKNGGCRYVPADANPSEKFKNDLAATNGHSTQGDKRSIGNAR